MAARRVHGRGRLGVAAPDADRRIASSNDFCWGPIVEVAKLFAGIFITIIPVIAMLRRGQRRAFSRRWSRW